MVCDIRVGTSGFHYKHWKGPFYPRKMREAAMLDFYTLHFDTVELNNSFYRLPTVDAFKCWRCHPEGLSLRGESQPLHYPQQEVEGPGERRG
jgi:uncharacterized protein YecE (DUF72 family)